MSARDYWYVPYCDEHGQVFGFCTSFLSAALETARELEYNELHVVWFPSEDDPAILVAVIRLIDGDVVFYGDSAVLEAVDPKRKYVDSWYDHFCQDFIYSHAGFDDSFILYDDFPF